MNTKMKLLATSLVVVLASGCKTTTETSAPDDRLAVATGQTLSLLESADIDTRQLAQSIQNLSRQYTLQPQLRSKEVETLLALGVDQGWLNADNTRVSEKIQLITGRLCGDDARKVSEQGIVSQIKASAERHLARSCQAYVGGDEDLSRVEMINALKRQTQLHTHNSGQVVQVLRSDSSLKLGWDNFKTRLNNMTRIDLDSAEMKVRRLLGA